MLGCRRIVASFWKQILELAAQFFDIGSRIQAVRAARHFQVFFQLEQGRS